MVTVSRPSAEKIAAPRLLAPIAAPTVATATIITVAWRRPPRMTGTARGSWMRVSTWDGLMPIPRAASATAGSTAAMPARVLRTMGSSAYMTRPTITGGKPNPSQMESSPNSAKLGMVRMVLVTARMTVANRSDRAASMPSTMPATLGDEHAHRHGLEMDDHLGAECVPIVQDVPQGAH